MSLTDFFIRKPEFEIFPIESGDRGVLAGLHKARFARAWSDGEFHALLSQDTVFGFVAWQMNASGRPAGGFVLARAAAAGVPAAVVGRVGGDRIRIAVAGRIVIDESRAALEEIWSTAIERFFERRRAIA